ncbi:hypothetical protein P8452_26655 [Trifolium repens]|nr:hypothetical protein P8452_26655 [Trifolium repens]
MESSSKKRLPRTESFKDRSNTFRTVVDPNQERIQICPTFKQNWYNELDKLPFGFINHRNGKSVMVDLILEDGQSFMRNGKNVGILFGFKEPTQINLHYYIEHNNFTLTTIPPTAEDDEMYVSDTDDYTLREYDNDRHYGWEHIIRDTKSQVEHIPPKTAAHVLRNREKIKIRTRHNGDGTKCTIKSYKRDEAAPTEMYLTEG